MQNESCKSTELKRWVTEMRWNKNSLSVIAGKVTAFLVQITDEIQCWSIDRSQALHRNGLEDVLLLLL